MMSQESRAALRRNFAVNVSDAAFFGFAQGAASFVTVIPLFVSQLTDSPLLIALIPAIHTLGWQLPQLLTARHVARLRRYLPFVLQMTLHERVPYFALALVALFLPRLGPSVALLLTYLLLIWQGFGGGFTATAWQSMIAKIMPAHRRGFFFGSQFAAASLGGAIAASLAGWLMQNLDEPMNFALTFAIAGVAMALSWGFLASTHEAPHQPDPPAEEGTRAFLRRLPAILSQDRNFAWYLFSRWLVQLGFMSSAFYSVFAVNRFELTDVTIGLYTSLMLITQMTLSPVVGWVGDRWGHRLVMGVGTLVLAGSALLAWAAPSGGWFALVFLLTGIGHISYWAPGNAMTLDFAPEHERQLYIGLANTVIAPAAILAPLLGGWLAANAGYPAAFLTSAVGGTLTALILLLVVRNPQRQAPGGGPYAEAQAVSG